MMDGWNIGLLGKYSIEQMTDRKNINRGFKKLIVWNDAIEIYVLANEILQNFPITLNKTKANCIDAAQSISRNIAEGYCRQSLKEYIRFLYIALGSCGEFHSCLYSFHLAKQINDENYEKLDILHYKTENGLLKMIKSLQEKMKNSDWNVDF